MVLWDGNFRLRGRPNNVTRIDNPNHVKNAQVKILPLDQACLCRSTVQDLNTSAKICSSKSKNCCGKQDADVRRNLGSVATYMSNCEIQCVDFEGDRADGVGQLVDLRRQGLHHLGGVVVREGARRRRTLIRRAKSA